jgi:hypothetical protein
MENGSRQTVNRITADLLNGLGTNKKQKYYHIHGLPMERVCIDNRMHCTLFTYSS